MPVENSTLNDVKILGYVGSEPKMIEFPSNGGLKAILSVATSRGKGDYRKTDWHTVAFRDAAAELVSKLKKGDVIYCEGFIEYKTWKDEKNNGIERLSVEINARHFIITKGEYGEVVRFARNKDATEPKAGSYANAAPAAPKAEEAPKAPKAPKAPEGKPPSQLPY